MEVRNNSRGRTAARYLGQNRTALGKTLEKLSSGYRINRAADDAAGLAISEKMRLQITGTGRAYENSREGVGLIKTGEGALEEIHAMLDRAAYLAEQSANGTYQDELDRESLQKELEQLCSEIDRIATSANFNGIELFQDRGYPYEGSTAETLRAAAKKQAETRQETAVQQQKSAETVPQEKTAEIAEQPVQEPKEPTTLDELLANPKEGTFNIVYVEEKTFSFDTIQNPTGGATTGDITLDDGQKLSDVLEKEIVPNTVNAILSMYPAFSYLDGSSIGIGLNFYHDTSSSVLASVSSGSQNVATSMTYKLSVNTGKIDTSDAGWRSKLESTIAHEMIHAFMFEATTCGMWDMDDNHNSTQGFPSWFIEGMAQTASGPGNWLKNSQSALYLTGTSDNNTIKTQISNRPLSAADSGASASQYGTGYLACMYLGAVIEGGGTAVSLTDANSGAIAIATGLSKLLKEVISGTSLDDAIKTLTNNTFISTSDFVTKFDSGANISDVGKFVRELLTATGTNGRGGLASGNLSDSDLIFDTAPSDTVKLFKLDTTTQTITNVYPADHKILTGGTTSGTNQSPTEFDPAAPVAPKPYSPSNNTVDFGDFVVTGYQDGDVEYDAASNTLTVQAGNGITITMKNPGSSVDKIVVNGGQNVTLKDLNLSGTDSLTINSDTDITYTGKNEIGGITLQNGTAASFKGNGQLKTGMFSSDNTNNIAFEGGAVIVGNGTGAINGNVTVTGASAAAAITPAPTDASGNILESIEFPWDKLGSNVASVQIGGATYKMTLDNTDPAKLWLDPNTPSQKVIFTDSSGKKITRTATYNVGAGKFEWAAPARPFTVSGTEGTDWYYEDDETLVIQSSMPLTISGGSIQDADGNTIKGRIKLADNISGTVNLTLNGVSSTVSTGSAFDLGKNNNVTINLADGTDNSFTSGENYAGISVGDGTKLTIIGKTATDPNAGKLSATGGKNGAGIGRNGISAASGKITDTTSFIKITGGIITATGGEHGAGIGAGEYCNFGDITIEDANIDATGGEGGAGIGGAYYSEVGDISIGKISGSDDITITAKSLRHGAGIGGGWTSTATNGTITINSGKITATSKEHGTGIGAGCQGTSGSITINGGNITAEGGSEGAGIGSSWLGSCGDITINGGDVKATGGYMGAGIGAGEDNSTVGKITINTDGTVTAEGGNNGVGIGSGLGEGSYRDPSKCGDIEILKGTVFAKGGTDSTGIGAGRGSTSGNITIGDKNNPNNKVIVSAQGGMKYNGGNISSYSDEEHTQEGTVTIVGDSTSVQPGDRGEGKYSTSGVVSGTDTLYCYPLYLKPKAPPDEADTLDPGKELAISNPKLLLPDNAAIVSIIATDSTGNELRRWGNNITHDPLDPNYVYLWMTGQDQKLTITYNGTEKMELDLKFDEKKGVFRLGLIDPPEDLEIPPEYNTVITPPPTPPSPSNPSSPSNPRPSGKGGIILQIGANFGEILEVPTFYLSRKALGLDKVDISTQQNAWDSMPVIKNAINRVSDIRGTYGALQNRLEHNMNDLSQSTENLTDAESRIRDADMAQEYANQVRLSISMQAAQAMLAQSNQNASQVLQLLQ